ncbi:hypothetical protein BDV26DRAFT_292537 [Aspergillus bertholletiae]|uniref:Uncharacterized protein n=1 Tax=Aspergillus bertholletiae TaxID=1226010 RepID=A0A5N7B8Y0_9EURO|nr:hypothetical protein BDV26DRAFT_292537 [Aspergillus bertholletiae]
MLPTVLPGWSSLQTLRSRLSGRLARFSRSDDSASESSSQTLQNKRAFFETDLRYLFITVSMVATIPNYDVHRFERCAQDLLSALNDIVNVDLVEALTALKTAARSTDGFAEEGANLHDLVPLAERYPDLSRLLSLLEASPAHFSLATDQGSSLFILPAGQAGDAVMTSLAEIKDLVSRVLYDANKQPTSLTPPLPTDDDSCTMLGQAAGHQLTAPHRYASSIVNSLFKDIRQRNCGKPHEIKLKVSDEWQTSAREVPLDMFFSCCLDPMAWHEAKCGPIQAAIDEARVDGICAAIQRARDQRRSIHLFVYKDGLFDISDTMPTTPLSAAHYTIETLQQLLDQKALTRITPGDYRSGLVEEKLSSREKAVLALGLARCFLEFFDADVDLASHSWKPEYVFFLRPIQGCGRDRILYISLKPIGTDSAGTKPTQSVGAIGPGHPALLSFAKLLLEIENGEKIPMEIYPQSRANLPTWGEMCDIVERVERDGGGNYLRAVEGCLYLHRALRELQKKAADLPLSECLRKTIYDQIVCNLEVHVNPQNVKRKRQDSVSDLPILKKLSFSPPTPNSNVRLVKTPTARQHHPTNRDDFEIAIVCALPLEFDAVSALIDEIWDEDYGRTWGDPNIYTNGRIGKFNVVLLLLSSVGKVSAATASTNLRSSYPRLSLVLVTGICGGVPFPGAGEEILLGDVIISRHIVQYDLGRQYPEGFETKDTVEDRFGRAPPNIRRLLTMLQTIHARERAEELTANYLLDIQQIVGRKPRGIRYEYPGASQDVVFDSRYQHKRRHSHSVSLKSPKKKMCGDTDSDSLPCEEAGCDFKNVKPRERIKQKQVLEMQGHTKEAQAPSIFVGTIGSADTVIKSAKERDRIASLHNLIAFEMEGAGLWDETPCIIVKSVCDYADCHKNKRWQNFAAATAASATKALLDFYPQRDASR